MKHINTSIHPDVKDLINPNTFERVAARAIVVKDQEVLLIYTAYYDDYTIPGGGVDKDEPIEEALIRELHEETGATNIEIIKKVGTYEEYRPYYKGYDQMHMISHIFYCSIDNELGEAKPEAYEVKNGSRPVWVNIDKAIEHNENIIRNKPDSMGQSVTRELDLLNLIKHEIIK